MVRRVTERKGKRASGSGGAPAELMRRGKRPKTPAVVATTNARKWLSSSVAVKLRGRLICEPPATTNESTRAGAREGGPRT